MIAHELDSRQFASFIALSIAVHAVVLMAPRAERAPAPIPESPVLVLEMVELAPVTAAPKPVEPPPPPPPPREQPPPPRPQPVVKAAPKPAPPVKAVAATRPLPPAPAAVPVPAPPPVARAAAVSPAAKARYEDVLYSWLVRHKEYPLVAKRRGIEGRPVVTVRIDRNGRVIANQVSSPSRYAMLDEAAVAMVRRADPFPPPPTEIAGDSYACVPPVEYRRR
jgi:protein TonB